MKLSSGRFVEIPKEDWTIGEFKEYMICNYPGEEPTDEPFKTLFELGMLVDKLTVPLQKYTDPNLIKAWWDGYKDASKKTGK